MKYLHYVVFALVIVGGLNWLMVGLLGWGVGEWLGETLAKVVYILIGLSAVYLVVVHKNDCKVCGGSSM